MGVRLHRAQRAGLAKAGDRAIHQIWTHSPQCGGIQTVPRHYTRGKVFHNHIGTTHQIQHEVASLRVGEIHGYPLLTHIESHVVAALIRAPRLELKHGVAYLVAFSRALDLDHARAEIGEQARAVGAREHARKVDDGHTIEQRFAGGWW